MPWQSVTVDFERCLLEPGSALQPKPANIKTVNKRIRVIRKPPWRTDRDPWKTVRATSVPSIRARLFAHFDAGAIGSSQQRCWFYSRWKSWSQKIGEAIV